MGFEELKAAVERVELVDAHAHNIVALDSSFPFTKCLTEAEGEALSDAPHSLSFKRNLRDIAEAYGVKPDLRSVEEYRRKVGLESITSTCFRSARISALLLDDGLLLDKKLDIAWHSTSVPVVGRILQIERFAEAILDEGTQAGSLWTLDAFTKIFEEKLTSVAGEIYGLKSTAAYRSGLDINPNTSKEDAEVGLMHTLRSGSPIRLTNKSFIDYTFTLSLKIALLFDLPIQIHNGFGDKDLDLRLANPLHLQKVLDDERFSKSRIVLLHSSYPFSKEASYLALVYHQVHLDFGLAVPQLSVHGMRSSIKELLDLAPINKVMFSTDGRAFPETFYLGAKKAREVVFSVLRDACIDGDLSIPEAIEAVQGIFAENAIKFYKINRTPDGSSNAVKPYSLKTETAALEKDISLVRIIWVDTSGQHRCRVVPYKRFNNVVLKNGVGLTFACMGMLSFGDGPADDTNLTATGEIRLVPDLSTRRQIPWEKQEEMVLADMHLKPGEAWEYCPREALRRVLTVLKDEFDLVMNAGFENEFYLLKSVTRNGKEEWLPIDYSSYCSSSAYDSACTFIHEIFHTLDSLDIPIEQLHAESGSGQFEFALGHKACHIAADNLIFARETVRAVARRHGMLATFLPKYDLNDLGSGSHVHLSLWRNGENVFMASDKSSDYGMSPLGQQFMAGVLDHLPSILALAAPLPNSYDRIQPNSWSGAYKCWGKDNREVPIRSACPPGIADGLVSNFEIKSFDGCANPHLSLAAVAAAGIDGLRRQLRLPKPTDANPSSLAGKLERLPTKLDDSIEALRKDNVIKESFGEKLWTAVIGVRKAEVEYYSKNKDAYKQLIHRY